MVQDLDIYIYLIHSTIGIKIPNFVWEAMKDFLSDWNQALSAFKLWHYFPLDTSMRSLSGHFYTLWKEKLIHFLPSFVCPVLDNKWATGRVCLEKQRKLTLPVNLTLLPVIGGVWVVAHFLLLLCKSYFGFYVFFVVCVLFLSGLCHALCSFDFCSNLGSLDYSFNLFL